MFIHERFSSLSPIYQGGLTNHAPMMITALRYLEVEEKQIEDTIANYVQTRGIFDLNQDLVKSNFDQEYVDLTNVFLSEIEHKGITSVIQNVLNKHRFSLHSALFHGLIRLAYAYMEEDNLLVAQALSYFSLCVEEGKVVGTPIDATKMDSIFANLVEYRKTGVSFQQVSSMTKYKSLLKEDFIRNNLFFPKDILQNKDTILAFYLNQYNKTNDFYILHVITGYHALHVLSQFFIEEVQVWRNFFMQTVLFLLFNDHQNYTEDENKDEFFNLIKKVDTLEDAHDIKLFFTLIYFYDKYQLEACKISANRLFKK